VLRRLRAAQVATPVLILSGLAELDNKVTGLGSGADDYLIKPVERRELIARVHAVVRRSMGHVTGAAAPSSTESGGLLARKGGAAPWSFDMSYRPAEDARKSAAPDPRAAGRNNGPMLRRPSRAEAR